MYQTGNQFAYNTSIHGNAKPVILILSKGDHSCSKAEGALYHSLHFLEKDASEAKKLFHMF